MPIDRQAAVDYARKFWNRLCDDNKFWTSQAPVSLDAKRREMKAPASDGWEAFFVSDGSGGEKAVFRRQVSGKIEEMANPIAVWSGPHGLDDCTHYVCRCLIKEGVTLTETPRANELSEAMIRSGETKTLALKTSKKEGQKIVDSGIFKAGDFVGYYAAKKSRYEHTAMFVGRQKGGPDDPGGITCHTVCRFEGLSAAWNGATDDGWFLHEEDGRSFTLVHFSADDAPISPTTSSWLPGWWKMGTEFYFVRRTGRAFATMLVPQKASQELLTGSSSGYYFDEGDGLIFTWKRPAAKIRVERWTAQPDGKSATVKVEGVSTTAERMF